MSSLALRSTRYEILPLAHDPSSSPHPKPQMFDVDTHSQLFWEKKSKFYKAKRLIPSLMFCVYDKLISASEFKLMDF